MLGVRRERTDSVLEHVGFVRGDEVQSGNRHRTLEQLAEADEHFPPNPRVTTNFFFRYSCLPGCICSPRSPTLFAAGELVCVGRLLRFGQTTRTFSVYLFGHFRTNFSDIFGESPRTFSVKFLF